MEDAFSILGELSAECWVLVDDPSQRRIECGPVEGERSSSPARRRLMDSAASERASGRESAVASQQPAASSKQPPAEHQKSIPAGRGPSGSGRIFEYHLAAAALLIEGARPAGQLARPTHRLRPITRTQATRKGPLISLRAGAAQRGRHIAARVQVSLASLALSRFLSLSLALSSASRGRPRPLVCQPLCMAVQPPARPPARPSNVGPNPRPAWRRKGPYKAPGGRPDALGQRAASQPASQRAGRAIGAPAAKLDLDAGAPGAHNGPLGLGALPAAWGPRLGRVRVAGGQQSAGDTQLRAGEPVENGSASPDTLWHFFLPFLSLSLLFGSQAARR